MAVSIQVSSIVGCSRVQGIPKVSAAGGSESLLRSEFLGSGSIHISRGTRTTQVVVHTAAKAGAIRSASFFEKLGQLFSSNDVGREQVLSVYEINERDRGSPVLLKGPLKDGPVPTLGDLVPYSNKVYDASGKRCLGISAGLCTCIENANGTIAGDRYETTYTHYLGDYGQLSAMGPYFNTSDSEMVVTGGTGIFEGARGVVKLHSVVPPLKILYTYRLTGIQQLPAELTIPVVPVLDEVPGTPAPVTAKA